MFEFPAKDRRLHPSGGAGALHQGAQGRQHAPQASTKFPTCPHRQRGHDHDGVRRRANGSSPRAALLVTRNSPLEPSWSPITGFAACTAALHRSVRCGAERPHVTVTAVAAAGPAYAIRIPPVALGRCNRGHTRDDQLLLMRTARRRGRSRVQSRSSVRMRSYAWRTRAHED